LQVGLLTSASSPSGSGAPDPARHNYKLFMKMASVLKDINKGDGKKKDESDSVTSFGH